MVKQSQCRQGRSQQFKKQVIELQDTLRLAHLLAEKCELREAQVVFVKALKLSKQVQDFKSMMEAISALIRLADEAMDEKSIENWELELNELMAKHPKHVPALIWQCKAGVAFRRREFRLAQRLAHRYLRLVRLEGGDGSSGKSSGEGDLEAKGWVQLAMVLVRRGRLRRAELLTQIILNRYEKNDFKSISGLSYLILGNIKEIQRQYDDSLNWYQRAHGSFLKQHDWYYHLHVLLGYARIARMQQHYSQAYWHLDLLEKATADAGFAGFRKRILEERNRLEQDAVDLLIDGRRGVVKTRENSQISLRKQYVLLGILEALWDAYSRDGTDQDRALSKAEIIRMVWNESYRPEIHDNKLYYNINRLRKLIEPDMREPQYLLNWKEGYRLAPGLRIRFVGNRKSKSSNLNDAVDLDGGRVGK